MHILSLRYFGNGDWHRRERYFESDFMDFHPAMEICEIRISSYAYANVSNFLKILSVYHWSIESISYRILRKHFGKTRVEIYDTEETSTRHPENTYPDAVVKIHTGRYDGGYASKNILEVSRAVMWAISWKILWFPNERDTSTNMSRRFSPRRVESSRARDTRRKFTKLSRRAALNGTLRRSFVALYVKRALDC